MPEAIANHKRILSTLSVGPQQHFELSAHDRRIASKLWLAGLVTLAPGDVWFITKRGLATLQSIVMEEAAKLTHSENVEPK